jgi:hypothetical protein
VKVQQKMEGAMILLDQISEYPNEVMQALDNPEKFAIVKELDALAERAAGIQSSGDLLGLFDAVYNLTIGRAALKALLLPAGDYADEEQLQRRVTLEDQQLTTELNDYAQQVAPQIRNNVVECREKLQALLDE